MERGGTYVHVIRHANVERAIGRSVLCDATNLEGEKVCRKKLNAQYQKRRSHPFWLLSCDLFGRLLELLPIAEAWHRSSFLLFFATRTGAGDALSEPSYRHDEWSLSEEASFVCLIFFLRCVEAEHGERKRGVKNKGETTRAEGSGGALLPIPLAPFFSCPCSFLVASVPFALLAVAFHSCSRFSFVLLFFRSARVNRDYARGRVFYLSRSVTLWHSFTAAASTFLLLRAAYGPATHIGRWRGNPTRTPGTTGY